MGRRAAPHWQRRFLQRLRRTGNVRVAAHGAGVDHSTAYTHRRRDARFAGRWTRAAGGGGAAPEAPAPGGEREDGAAVQDARQEPPRPGGEALVARRSKKHGMQMVRAAEGRFSAKRRDVFLAALRATGCVRRAAAAAQLSTTALYYRRKHYPDFAAEWARAEEDAKAQLHGFVVSAGLAAFDPDGPGDADVPKVTVSEAIAILRLKGTGPSSPAPAAAARAAEEPPIEQVRDEVLRQVAAIRRKGAERDGEQDREGGA